jgi:hypothetical protein
MDPLSLKVQLPDGFTSLNDCKERLSAVKEDIRNAMCAEILNLGAKVDQLWGAMYQSARVLQAQIRLKQEELGLLRQDAGEGKATSAKRIARLEAEVATLLNAVKITTDTLQANKGKLGSEAFRSKTARKNDVGVLLNAIKTTTRHLENLSRT